MKNLRMKYFYKRSLFIFLTIFSFTNLNFQSQIKASNKIDQNINPLKSENLKTKIKTPYIVDNGDALNITFIGIPYFTGKYLVNNSGEIVLPEIYNINVSGLTLREIENLLIEKYQSVIKNPQIKVYLNNPRDITIFIHGEVNRPGLYNLKNTPIATSRDTGNYNLEKSKASLDSVLNPQTSGGRPPKLYSAIQIAKGIKNYSNLREIQIIRDNALSQGGGKIKATIDLLSLIETGDQSVNIDLRDGDTIFIPKAAKSFKKQFFELNSINLNPGLMGIYMNGQISQKGFIQIPSGSTLNEAIAFSGGRGFKSGKIRLIRFDTENKKKGLIINYNPNASKGSKNNPYLENGDIVVVNNNIIGKANTILTEIGSPLINAYGIISLFD